VRREAIPRPGAAPGVAAPAPTPRNDAVVLRGVSRLFGGHAALVGVDLEVGAGEVVLVLGPNGAGKSTLLRLIATALVPTFGRGNVLGHDLVRDRTAIRARVELLGHRTRLYEDLTPAEYLRFVDRMDGRRSDDDAHPAALERTGLTEVRDVRMSTFSNGMRQRVAIARARLRRPDLLLLDEPYAGLDASAMDAVGEAIVEARERGGTVLVATHDARRGMAIADRVVHVDAGRVLDGVGVR
jgi:ABC-type multidrug transport system ATPase subunit